MIFTKSVRCVALLMLLALNTACQFVAKESVAAKEPDATETADVTAVKAERTPNPYLQNRSTVDPIAAQRFNTARVALAAGNIALAEQELLWLTRTYPDLAGPHLNLALLYRDAQQFDKVGPAFEQALKSNANNIDAYNQYAIYLRERGDFAGAEKLYQRALAVWPDHPASHLNLGILYDLYMGKLELALQQYQAYQQLQEKPDRKVAGWIIDTERRLAAGEAP